MLFILNQPQTPIGGIDVTVLMIDILIDLEGKRIMRANVLIQIIGLVFKN